MAKPYLSLIIPVRNEEATILQTLIAVDYALSLSEFSSEVIVVDDGSHDSTPEIVVHFEKVLRSLRTIRGRESQGVGWAMKEGMRVAKGNVRMIVLPTRIHWLDNRNAIMNVIRDGADVVMGSRNKERYKRGVVDDIQFIMRKMGNALLCGKEASLVSDVRFGGIAMRESVAEWLFSFPELSNESAIMLQLAVLALGNGYTLRELPYHRDEVSAFGGFRDWMRMWYRSFRIRKIARTPHAYRMEHSGTEDSEEV